MKLYLTFATMQLNIIKTAEKLTFLSLKQKAIQRLVSWLLIMVMETGVDKVMELQVVSST